MSPFRWAVRAAIVKGMVLADDDNDMFDRRSCFIRLRLRAIGADADR